MERLIKAEKLKERFPKDEDWDYPVNSNSLVCEEIDNQPTVDAEPVIRCRDCKYYDCEEGELLGALVKFESCHRLYIACEGDGYCSWAERKAE